MIELKYPARKYRTYLLMICGVGLYFFANFQRVGIPGTVFDQLQSSLHVSAPYVTAFGAAFMYIYALGQLIVGLFADRYGGIRTILGGGILFCLGALLFPLSKSLPLMYFCRFLTGLGASSIYLSMVKEVLRVFPRNYSIMLSVLLLLGYSGGIAAGAPFSKCADTFGMNTTLIVCALIGIAFYCGFLFFSNTLKLIKVQKSPLNLLNYIHVLKVRHNCKSFLFSGINFGLYYVLQTVLGKKFLQDYCGMAATNAAWVLSVMTAINACAGCIYAVISSKLLHNKRTPLFRISGTVCVLAFSGILLMLVCDCHSSWLALLLLMMAFTSNMGPIFVPMLNETNEPNVTGQAIAFSNFTSYFLVAVFGNMSGFLLNAFEPVRNGDVLVYTRNSYLLLFSVMIFFAIICCSLSFQIVETNGKRTKVC